MPSDLESAHLTPEPQPHEALTRWAKVGVVAAATALAGGLAAAWWYRKTLARLHEAEDSTGDTHFKILDD
jgi:hypothetical protein